MADSLKLSDWKNIPLIKTSGYFDEKVGKALETMVMGLLREKKNTWILDLNDCEVINSPGIAAIFELCIKTKEDFSGEILIVGVKALTRRVFQMAGIFPLAEEFPSLEEIRG